MVNLLTLIMSCSLYQDNATVNAMIELGSHNNPYKVTVIEPNGNTWVKESLTKPAAAASFAQQQLNAGNRLEIGLMQLPSLWLSKFHGNLTLEDLFRPCKNMVVATNILNHTLDHCASLPEKPQLRACALSFYKTGSSVAGAEYAQSIINYSLAHPMVNNKFTQPIGDQISDRITQQPIQLKLPSPKFNSAESHSEAELEDDDE